MDIDQSDRECFNRISADLDQIRTSIISLPLRCGHEHLQIFKRFLKNRRNKFKRKLPFDMSIHKSLLAIITAPANAHHVRNDA